MKAQKGSRGKLYSFFELDTKWRAGGPPGLVWMGLEKYRPARTIQPVVSCYMTALSQAYRIMSFVENCRVRAVFLL